LRCDFVRSTCHASRVPLLKIMCGTKRWFHTHCMRISLPLPPAAFCGCPATVRRIYAG